MFNILIKKEYRNKFKFTNFLYNDLWSLCEKYFDHVDETKKNATEVVNAMVACYNIVLYCGRTAIDDNTKVNVDAFIINQTNNFLNEDSAEDITNIFYPSYDNSILVQLFNVTETFLQELDAEELLNNFLFLKERAFQKFNEIELTSYQK